MVRYKRLTWLEVIIKMEGTMTLRTRKVLIWLWLASCPAFVVWSPGLLKAASITDVDRVVEAMYAGKISRREAVILWAQLLFAPETAPRDSEFASRTGEAHTAEGLHSVLYCEFQRVYDILSQEDKAFLGDLDPNLRILIDEREGLWSHRTLEAPQLRLNALTETITTTNFVIHYTSDPNSPDVIPYADYPRDIGLQLELAAKKMPGDFNGLKPIPKEGKSLLDVLLRAGPNGNPGGYGYTQRNFIAGTRKAWVWFEMSTKIPSRSVMKGVCFHEYFHGMQFARNARLDPWVLEGTAVWAMCHYGEAWKELNGIFSKPDSLFRKPWLPLWYLSSDHLYSTSALFFHLADRYGQHKVISAVLEAAELENDGIKILKKILSDRGNSFPRWYREHLIALYCKTIPSLAALPASVLKPTVWDVRKITPAKYGFGPYSQEISLTGAFFVEFRPPEAPDPGKEDTRGENLILTFQPLVKHPQPYVLYFVKGQESPLQPPFKLGDVPEDEPYKASLVGFRDQAEKAVMLITDTAYVNRDEKPRRFRMRGLLPYMKIKEVVCDPPVVHPGESMASIVTYDFLGWTDGGSRKVQYKGKTVEIIEGQKEVFPFEFEIDLPPGANQTYTRQDPVYNPDCGAPEMGITNIITVYVPPLDWRVPSAKSPFDFSYSYVEAPPCGSGWITRKAEVGAPNPPSY
jgi:hypothetical protein